MKISQLDIIKFRHLENISIKIWTRLTAIAWQNWTWKSTVLWLLGHICKEKSWFKTFDNKWFETDYSEIFKFSFPTYDKPKEHIYEVFFNDWTTTRVVSYARKQAWKSESLRLRVWKSSEWWWKIDFPVIFLWLKRLYPLAQERKVSSMASTLSETELKFYSNSHNSILLLWEEITSEEVKTNNKHFIAAKSDKYDAIWNSAGQDNIWQIITSIISFQRLKSKLWIDYKWWILLIDELDASMFPAAQKKLIEFLFKVSSELELQIVFTTHSIEILEILLVSKYHHQSEVCYFHKSSWFIEKAEDTKLPEIISDLRAEVLQEKIKESKIDIYMEDKEAEIFLKSLLHPQIKKKINIIQSTFWAEELLNLAKKKIPAFNKSIIILDWDKTWRLWVRNPSNVIILPWSDSPEKIIFNYLSSLDSGHYFWWSLWGYTKQICFKDLSSIWDREQMKKWWATQLPFWWTSGRNILKLWKTDNVVLVEKFISSFELKIQQAYKKINR